MSEPSCINLQERFGKRYRVSWEAGGATRYQWPEADRPWLMEIRGRRGVVYPVGGEILTAVGTGARIGAKLRALPCIRSARGELEVVVTFHVDHVPAVLGLLKPYRRRQVSEAARERLATVGARFRFSAGHGVQSEQAGLESTQTPARAIGAGGSHAL
ncbi:MAG: hypothetical protein ABSA52_21760 [Candidatus Binatia bacterium]|jgi:hypothetical protein